MSAQVFSRRHGFRLLGGAALAAVPALRFAGDASAARGWCRADPVLRIAGQTVHLYISSPAAMLKSATDKIRLVVMLPAGVDGKRIDVLADFGRGYDIRFVSLPTVKVVNGRVPALVTVYCPARDATLPVNVDFAPIGAGPLAAASASGKADALITLLAC
jgi:hypothetical protein